MLFVAAALPDRHSSHPFDITDAAVSSQQRKLDAGTSTGLAVFINYLKCDVL